MKKGLADGTDVSCERREIKDFSRVGGLSNCMNEVPFTETGTLGEQTCCFRSVGGEKGRQESALYFGYVTFQMPVKYPREDANGEFLNVKLRNTSVLEMRKQGKQVRWTMSRKRTSRVRCPKCQVSKAFQKGTSSQQYQMLRGQVSREVERPKDLPALTSVLSL